jgi:hypothetical protein
MRAKVISDAQKKVTAMKQGSPGHVK